MDWKFVVTLTATVAGVVVPVWLWQSDLASKSIAISVKSTTELRSDIRVPGLTVSIDGKPIEDPTIVELRIANTGSRPILSADFESPLEIRFDEPSIVLRANPKKMSPADLKPQTQTTTRSITISPLLLNPKDNFHLIALVDGRTPKFSASARIAGIGSVEVNDDLIQKRTRKSVVKSMIITALMYIYTCAVFSVSVSCAGLANLWPAVTAFLALTTSISLLDNIGVDFVAAIFELAPMLAMSLAIAFATLFVLRQRRSAV